MSSRTRDVVRLASWVGLYLVAGVVGRLTIIDGHSLSLVWPAAGVGMLWLATSDRRRIAADLAGLAATVFVVNASTGAPTALALLFVLTNLLQAGSFVLLLRRLRPDLRGFGGVREPGSLVDLGMLTGAALVSCLVAAAVGHVGLGLLGTDGTLTTFLVWWGRNMTGLLVVGMLGLLLLGRLAGAAGPREVVNRLRAAFWPSTHEATGALGVAAVSVGLLWFVFGASDALPVGFLLLFTTVLAGVRLGPLGVVVHGLAVGAGSVAFTLAGSGPFAAISEISERALVAQVFVTMTIITGLVLAFSRVERNQALADLSLLQRETAERAKLFGAVLEHMKEGVAVVDAEGTFLLRNPAGRQMLGLTQDTAATSPTAAAVSGHLTDLDGREVPADQMPYRLALAGEDVLRDYRFQPPDGGEPMILEVTASALPIDHGLLPANDRVGGREGDTDADARVIISYRDVTAARHDRDALATFAGVVAHDLKRPLTVINGWSEALAEDFRAGPVSPEDGSRMLTRVTDASRQMGHFIDDLLSYTVVRDAPVHPIDVDLSRAADEAATIFRERSNRPQIYVQTGLHALADPVLVRQILDNLIGNATKYVAAGVRPRVQVRGREDADWTLLTVTDNGIGVPAEQREQIFETFHRAHGAAYRGTGLGLAIVRRAVERSGGSIHLRDNPTGGSIFEVRLPPAPSAPVVAAPETRAVPARAEAPVVVPVVPASAVGPVSTLSPVAAAGSTSSVGQVGAVGPASSIGSGTPAVPAAPAVAAGA